MGSNPTRRTQVVPAHSPGIGWLAVRKASLGAFARSSVWGLAAPMDRLESVTGTLLLSLRIRFEELGRFIPIG